ncbi:Barstar (barnase inhibitor) [Lentzea waywayandensis]|uniref:Barstar (Barnase inhibitor) n=1 Tax=Lentzea waywayandensis TaxID=84724 RepID=A0A1I6E5H9_9PSEU|nr:barstar family protein [Lentzea waywayandensis]SFR13000.1 Barstar (barnase inhibitor) [Lentzea waywayandensis]
MFEHGLVEVPPGQLGRVEADAAAAGMHVIDLSAEIGAHPSWEALADDLWDQAHASGTVVVWPGSRAFRLAAPQDYRHALAVLDGIAAAVFIERNDLEPYEIVALDTYATGVVLTATSSMCSVVVDGVVHDLRRDQVDPTSASRMASAWFGEVVCDVLVSARDRPIDLSHLEPAAAVEVRTWLRIAGLADARPTPFGLALAELVLATGRVADLASEHGRWELYETSFGRLDLLRAAVRHEPDGVLAKSVVLAVLPLTDDHSAWFEVADDEHVRSRSREIGVLRRAVDLTREEIDVWAWSDWLQLRLAELPAPAVLRALVDEGRTKRVRRLAFATLRTVPD